MLRERLIQCGWRDDLKEYCKDVIRKKGLEKVTIEDLVAEITPKGRATVPEDVKAGTVNSYDTVVHFLYYNSPNLFRTALAPSQIFAINITLMLLIIYMNI